MRRHPSARLSLAPPLLHFSVVQHVATTVSLRDCQGKFLCVCLFLLFIIIIFLFLPFPSLAWSGRRRFAVSHETFSTPSVARGVGRDVGGSDVHAQPTSWTEPLREPTWRIHEHENKLRKKSYSPIHDATIPLVRGPPRSHTEWAGFNYWFQTDWWSSLGCAAAESKYICGMMLF